MKAIESGSGKSLRAESELTAEGSSMMLKQFETKVAQDLKRKFTELKRESAKLCGGVLRRFCRSQCLEHITKWQTVMKCSQPAGESL